ncbi:MAG: zinc ribbon domain-containing protein [Gemmatimonadaceae bacterium]|nr:zinc ribbon domain-containing protein [Gemmatimonadaceae bacterium]
MTAAPSPSIIDRLFVALVRSVRRHQPDRLARGMDVAEILQFVPYKAVRAEIGADTDDDYGHAMTRLLAGDGGYVFADDLMQDDLRAELNSKNPNLQAYRSYLNTTLSLAQERVRAALDALGPAESQAPSAGVATAAAQAAPPTRKSEPQQARPAAQRAAAPRPAAAKARPLPDPTATVTAEAGARRARPGCRYCGQQLPQAREVRFCPHCGQDLAVRRCGGCSAELEPGWKFCVVCGRASAP